MDNNDRTSRDQESRVAEERVNPADEFGTPSLLDAKNMPPREGFVQRWIRTSINNEDDQSNVYRNINQGWKPRLASTVPKGEFVPQVKYQGSDIIGIHGMILMERPIETHKRQHSYEKRMADNQMSAVKNDMHKVHDSGSGLTRPEFIEQQSRVSKGRIAPVAPDD
jgi:hypothetical protein